MRNDPYAGAEARRPGLLVLLNGTAAPGVVSATVTSNNWYQADRFSLVFALFADPAMGIPWWGDQNPPLMVEIKASLDGSSWQSLLIGEVDHIQVQPNGTAVRVDGRDLTARFIETRTQETFLNQTSSEVAEALAARHGLSAQVVATTTLVGRYYDADHDHLTLNQFARTTTEWDLLTYLAQREGFDCFVFGTTLYFQPKADITAADPYVVVYQAPSPTPMVKRI